MKIIVRNNDAVKAYRVLMKNLNKEYNGNYFRELRKKMRHTPKSQYKREKHEKAVLEVKKLEEKRYQWFLKEEKRAIIDSKKKARELKKRRKQETDRSYHRKN